MKRNGNVWGKVLLGMIGVGATIWIIIVSLGAAGTREWEAYAASLRAKGQPLTFAEIEARRAVISDDMNSARVVEGLRDELQHIDQNVDPNVLVLGSKNRGDLFTGIPKGRVEASRLFLEKHKEILDKLAMIHDKPTGRFVIEYNKANPIETLLPNCTDVRAASKVAHLDGMIKSMDGDWDGAFRDFEIQVRLAGAMGDEPTLISRLVQVAVEALAIQSAEEMLRAGAPEVQLLTRMAEEMAARKRSGTLKWALLGERAFFAETCEALLGGANRPSVDVCTLTGDCNSFPGSFVRLPTFLVRANQLRGVQMHTSLIESLDDSVALDVATRKFEQEVKNLPRTQMLLKIFMPSLTRSITTNTRIAAQLDCGVAALAAERFRLAEGHLPGTLDQLVPAYLPSVPVDPFDRKPLKVGRTEQGIVIYSVDENGIDDGGDVAWRKEHIRTRPQDVGFRLNDADHRGVQLIDDPPKEDD